LQFPSLLLACFLKIRYSLSVPPLTTNGWCGENVKMYTFIFTRTRWKC